MRFRSLQLGWHGLGRGIAVEKHINYTYNTRSVEEHHHDADHSKRISNIAYFELPSHDVHEEPAVLGGEDEERRIEQDQNKCHQGVRVGHRTWPPGVQVGVMALVR